MQACKLQESLNPSNEDISGKKSLHTLIINTLKAMLILFSLLDSTIFYYNSFDIMIQVL